MNKFEYLEKKYGLIKTGRNYRLNCGGEIIFSISDSGQLEQVASLEVINKEIRNKKQTKKRIDTYNVEKRMIKHSEFVYLGTDKSLYYGNTHLYFKIKNSNIIIKVLGDRDIPYTVLVKALEYKTFNFVNKFDPNAGSVSKYDLENS